MKKLCIILIFCALCTAGAGQVRVFAGLDENLGFSRMAGWSRAEINSVKSGINSFSTSTGVHAGCELFGGFRAIGGFRYAIHNWKYELGGIKMDFGNASVEIPLTVGYQYRFGIVGLFADAGIFAAWYKASRGYSSINIVKKFSNLAGGATARIGASIDVGSLNLAASFGTDIPFSNEIKVIYSNSLPGAGEGTFKGSMDSPTFYYTSLSVSWYFGSPKS